MTRPPPGSSEKSTYLGARRLARDFARHHQAQWLTIAAIVVVMISLFAADLARDHKETLALEHSRLATQAQVIALNVENQLAAIDRVLTNLAREAVEAPAAITSERDSARDSERLRELTEILPGVSVLLVIDANGYGIRSSLPDLLGQNLATREYFQRARGQPLGSPLVVSAPFLTVSGVYSVTVSRTIADEWGRFAGVAVAALTERSLGPLLESVIYAKDMRVQLARPDALLFSADATGTQISAQPTAPDKTLLGHWRSGRVESTVFSMDSGIRQLVIRSISPTTPRAEDELFVLVSRDRGAVLAPWLNELFAVLWAGGLFLVVSLFALLAFRRNHARTISLLDTAWNENESMRARLTGILEGTRVGTWEWNVQTGETTFNERWAEIVGCTLAELSPTNIDTWLTLAHPDDLKQSGELLERHFSGELDYYECEARMRHKDGHWVWVHDRGKVATRDASGRPLLMLGTHTDITRRKQTELALTAARQDAEAANQAKTRFLANISHEIRTPLSAILGLTDLLGESDLSAGQADQVGKIAIASRALRDLLDDVLALARVETEDMRLNIRAFDLHDLAAEITTLLGPGAKAKGLVLNIALDKPRPWQVHGDRPRLRQVLLNLAGNAIKFSEGGSIDIVMRETGHTADAETVRFAVADTGIGIASDRLEKIFEPFTQEHEHLGGTGLGLAISRRLARLMNSDVRVESRIGMGSTFWLDVRFAASGSSGAPRTEDHRQEADTRDAGTTALASERPLLTLRILLVEDDQLNREVISTVLRNAGAVVHAVASATDALTVIDRAAMRYDAIVTDLRMPGMDGFEFIDVLRRNRQSTIPILALSATADHHALALSHAVGANRLLSKPIDRAALVSALRALARHPSISRIGEPPKCRHDIAAAQQRTGLDAADFARVCERFVAAYSDCLAELVKLLGEEDLATLERRLHKLKGAAASLGLTGLVSEIETLGQQLTGNTASLAVLGRLADELSLSLHEVKSHNRSTRIPTA